VLELEPGCTHRDVICAKRIDGYQLRQASSLVLAPSPRPQARKWPKILATFTAFQTCTTSTHIRMFFVLYLRAGCPDNDAARKGFLRAVMGKPD